MRIQGLSIRSSLSSVAGNGTAWLLVVAMALILLGLGAMILGVSGRFLPHDERFLGMTAEQLCSMHGCRIVHFMIHDRVSFGGAAMAVGVLWCWIVAIPLRRGRAWAWWLMVLAGMAGFGSFFAFLGYGYCDIWHALATIGLFPGYLMGMIRSSSTLGQPKGIHSLFQPSVHWSWKSAAGLGRGSLLATAAGMAIAGLTTVIVGMTSVFVPQDLSFMGVSAEELRAFNPRLGPLIAHDRAGFGGAVACCGMTLWFCIWCGEPSRGLWWLLAAVGAVGFGTAIGVHPAVGYTDVLHLGPAVLGAGLYLVGLVFTYRPMVAGGVR